MSKANMTGVASMDGAETLTDEQWGDRLSAVVEAGFGAVEVPADTPAERISLAAKRGVGVAVLRSGDDGASPRLASSDVACRARALERVKADLDRAAGVGASVLTVRPAESRLGRARAVVPEYAEALRATLEALRRLVGPAALHGVAIGVEVAADGFLLSPVEARELLELAGTPDIGACVDLGVVSEVGRPTDWIQTLRHRIVCVRVDCRGDADVEAAALAEVRYGGPVVLGGEPAEAGRQWKSFVPPAAV